MILFADVFGDYAEKGVLLAIVHTEGRSKGDCFIFWKKAEKKVDNQGFIRYNC